MQYQATMQSERTTRDPKRFSLGAGLIGGQPADGFWSTSDASLDAWLQQLTAQHPHTLLEIFMACKSGRDWVLRDADKCSISLCVTQARAPALKNMSWLSAALRVRSTPQTTKLSLTCDESAEAVQAILSLPERLEAAGAGQAVTDLALSAGFPAAPASQFLQLAASVFPNLTTLNPPGCVLPSPAQLPHLQQLTISQDGDLSQYQALRSVRQLLPQLTTLAISIDGSSGSTLDALFTGQPSHTLTHLTLTGCRLTNDLVRLLAPYPALTHLTLTGCSLTDSLVSLLEPCPALTHLAVKDVSELTARSRGVQWGVKVLTIMAYASTRVISLVNVPRAREGSLQLRCGQAQELRVWPHIAMDGGVWDLSPHSEEVRENLPTPETIAAYLRQLP